jgi:DNA-binding NarL/FixJ family response regulator
LDEGLDWARFLLAVDAIVLEDELSSRELEVALRVRVGMSNKAIAFELGISLGTVASHIRRIRRKLRASSRRDIIVLIARRDPVDAPKIEMPLMADRMARVTPAEQEILAEVLLGMTNLEIAVSRQRSPRTIACQISSLIRKACVTCRAELVATLVQGPKRSVPSASACGQREPGAVHERGDVGAPSAEEGLAR